MSTLFSCLTPRIAVAIEGGSIASGSAPRMKPPAPTPVAPPEDRENIDATLLTRVAQHDRDAFTLLYDRFSGPLYGTAVRILREPAEAQDVVHDAFVTIWEKAATFDPARGTPFSWAITLVRNRAIDRLRMHRRRSELLAESAHDDLAFGGDRAGSSAADAAAQGDQAVAIRAAVATLPVDQQRALELAFFTGLTQEEIAEKLKTPLGTVKARIRRGLLKLRDAIARRT